MSTNSLKTLLLLGGMSALVVAMGDVLGGRGGMMIGLALAVGMNFFSYFFSEKMALASSGAIRVGPNEHPQIYGRIAPMTERLCQRMGLPMPKLWVLDEPSPNAFATGRNPANSSVAVSVGLLELMNDREVEAVIAHELAHIKHRDILISSVAATLGAVITNVARFGYFFGGGRSSDDDGEHASPMVGMMMLILAPFAAMLIQLAVSRTREYAADAAAAKYTGGAENMVSALNALQYGAKRIPMDASPAMSHMYIFPAMGKHWFSNMFSTHPSTEDRIARLRSYGSPAAIEV